MSARKEDFEKFLFFLQEHRDFFNAPYGIIEGTIAGKYPGSVVAYTVTFGQARTMDAYVKVFSEKKIEFESQGYYQRFNGTYKSIEELIEVFSTYL